MEPKKSEKVFAKKEILQPQGDFQVKLNVGGIKYETYFSTISKFGPNFFTQLVQTNMNARKDEDGYYFVDRYLRYNFLRSI